MPSLEYMLWENSVVEHIKLQSDFGNKLAYHDNIQNSR